MEAKDGQTRENYVAQVAEIVVEFTAKGYPVSLRICDESGVSLLNKLKSVVHTLERMDYSPPVAAPASPRPAASGGGGSGGGTPHCPTHKVALLVSKFGGWYCPAVVENGDKDHKAKYCTYKVSARGVVEGGGSAGGERGE